MSEEYTWNREEQVIASLCDWEGLHLDGVTVDFRTRGDGKFVVIVDYVEGDIRTGCEARFSTDDSMDYYKQRMGEKISRMALYVYEKRGDTSTIEERLVDTWHRVCDLDTAPRDDLSKQIILHNLTAIIEHETDITLDDLMEMRQGDGVNVYWKTEED